MRPLRLLLIGAAALLVLCAVLVALAFNASVQTWAARRALAATPDLKGTLTRVDIGLHQTRIEGLRLEQPGMVLTVPSATVELPLLAALRRTVSVKTIVAHGFTVDLTSSPAAPPVARAGAGAPLLPLASLALAQASAGTTPAATRTPTGEILFDGVFHRLDLPVDLAIGAADLSGDVLFAIEPGTAPGRAQVSVKGGGLEAGREAEFKIAGTAQLPGAKATVDHLSLNGVLHAAMETPRTVRKLALAADIDARGPQFPNGARLRAELKAERTASDESYAVRLRSVDQRAGKELVTVQATYPAATRLLAGTWRIDARDADLKPFTMGFALPAFVVNGAGRFETDGAFEEVHAVGRFDAVLDDLEMLNPHLAVVGSASVVGEFDLVQHGDAVRVERLIADVTGAGPIVSVHALQGFELSTATGELRLADPLTDLVQVKLHGIPLAWARPFLEKTEVEGGPVQGEFAARALNGGVAVRTVAPLSVRGLTVRQEGETLLQNVDVTGTLAADYTPSGWQADVQDLAVLSGGTPLLSISLRAGKPSDPAQPLKSTGQYRVSLALAGRQPAGAALSQLTRGELSGDFTAVVTEALQQLAVTATVRDLAAAGVDRPLPVLSTSSRIDLHGDGRIKVVAPLVIQQGDRRSDLDLTSELQPTEGALGIDAQVLSEVLYVEDAQVLLAPFQGAEASDAPTVRQEPDNAPFWKGINGEVRIALKKVIYSPDVQAGNLTGTIKIGPEALTVDNLRAVLGEGSEARVHGGLTHQPKETASYSLAGDVNVTNVNPGPILAALSPEKKATVEGQFNVTGRVSAKAASVDLLGEAMVADLKMTSRSGRFNGFAASARAGDVGKAQRGLSTAAAAVELLSGMLGESRIEREAARVRAVSDVLGRLGNIAFDQLNLEVTHRPGEDTKIKDFSLISPDLRFIGAGGIKNLKGIHFLQRPLDVQLQFAVRGEQARDLKLLGAIKTEPDALGYFPLLEPVGIQGSLSSISSDALGKLMSKYQSRTE